MRTSPLTFVSSTVCSSSSVDSANGSRPSARPGVVDEDVEPAELGERALDERARSSPGSVTSSSSATSASISSTRRAPPATRAPSSRSARTVAAPMPLDAPVTIAVFPSREAKARELTDARSSAVAAGRARPGASCARGRSARAASARDRAARRGSRRRARRARARRARGSRSSPSRRAGRAPRRRSARRRARGRRPRGRCPSGERSRKIDADSRSRPQLAQSISAATPRLAIGSKRFQPVRRMSAPAIAVPTNAARSVATCRNAPRTLRLSRDARESTAVAATLTATPTSATTRTIPPRTSVGVIEPAHAPKTISSATTSSVTPFACAARISRRL